MYVTLSVCLFVCLFVVLFCFVLQSCLTDSSWTKDETEHLFDLCRCCSYKSYQQCMYITYMYVKYNVTCCVLLYM